MALTAAEKSEIIAKFGANPQDTGKTEVQIAILTADIKGLTEHFKINKKDSHSRRGLLAKVNKRRKLLDYLKSNEYPRYTAIIAALGLRR